MASHSINKVIKQMNNYNDAFNGWDHATIRKCDSDYISFKTNKVATGSFWKIEFDNGFLVELPASLGKGRAIEYVHNAVAYCKFTTIK